MITFILIVIVISVLILVHEWGHFYSARKLGVKVEEFGIGFSGREFGFRFPPKLATVVRSGVRYTLNPLPFGGFVKIFGEHGEDENKPESFASRPIWQRVLIIGAGVLMNFVLAWVLFSGGAILGVPELGDESGGPVSIVGVLPNSPAEKAGLKFGDAIVEMRAQDLTLRVEAEKDVRDFIQAYRGEEIMLFVKRGQEVLEIKAVPRAEVPEGEGPLGVALGYLTLRRTPWYLAPVEGAKMLGRSTVAVLEGFGMLLRDLLTTGKTSAEVSGPVGIFFFADDTRMLGIAYFLQFVGILSVNLAILNVLPIPALDGGRLFFLLLEKIKGTKINPQTENIVHGIGFLVLIVLMVLITYKDIARLF
ncbi:MAG: RIP metalloprotease RseP [Candidatus Sungbacteria bacterium]|nr:RIP metalloprotease RseP [Candidatus Sungbacteria bacterium]